MVQYLNGDLKTVLKKPVYGPKCLYIKERYAIWHKEGAYLFRLGLT